MEGQSIRSKDHGDHVIQACDVGSLETHGSSVLTGVLTSCHRDKMPTMIRKKLGIAHSVGGGSLRSAGSVALSLC